MTKNNPLRALPAVDRLLHAGQELSARYGREALLGALRTLLDEARAAVRDGTPAPDTDTLLLRAEALLAAALRPTLRPVVNATGVIIHTNLGRAPLSQAAQQALLDVAGQYSTLEFDLDDGKRGSRLLHAEPLLCAVTEAEAGFAVNNAAAALVLLLSELAQGREVLLSRGQLVEIGGSFRVPDIMAQSGARLVEVGTTNRTRVADYAQAITPESALLMRVHASNFKQIGFVESAPLDEMAAVAHAHGLLLVDDLGSGALLNTEDFGLEHEPTVQESLRAGADIVVFSGDKLLGGPQAGILVGRKAVIARLKRHPLARAVRADKLCLAALSATLEHYRRGEAVQHVPVWQMIARPLSDLQQTAQRWRQALDWPPAAVIAGESTVGGGSLPGATLPTALLALPVRQPDDFLARLRAAAPPVIARISDARVLFDPRTVLQGQDTHLLASVKNLLTS
ncbi:MAG: L-seryl-tRNA(Sec) selenium transferase [Chloroflexi bacterium]|nr:L-seryl-tRNA(Sec) selenium transferase [Chloroflexota bacterium]